MIIGFVVQVAWRIWLASPISTPVVFGDEGRYLIFARVLSGGPGGFGGDTEATRRAGYALLISPVYWFKEDPFVVYRVVQWINAPISALTLPLGHLFCRRVLGTSPSWAFGLAFVAASLPAVAFFAAFALPNAVLTPLLLVWLLGLHGWMTARTARATVWTAGVSGAAVGYMYVIHVRALLLLGIHLLVVAALLVTKRTKVTGVFASLAPMALMLAVHPILKAALRGKVVTGGTEPEDRMWEAFTTVDGILRTISDAAGQIWYLGISSWGMAAVGLFVAANRLITRQGYEWPTAVVLGVCLLNVLAIATVTAAALPADGKVNNHIYPGYVIFLAPVWVMVALAALRGAGWRSVLFFGAGGASLLLAAWFVVESYTRPLGPLGKPGIFSAIDAPEALVLGGDWDQVHLAKVTVVALAAILIWVLVMCLKRPAIVAAMAIVTIAGINAEVMAQSREQMGEIASGQSGPQLVRDAGVRPGEFVVSDRRVFARYNHEREVYWRAMPLIDLAEEAPPREADVVVSMWYTGKRGVDWDGSRHGWRFVAGDPRTHWAVWRRVAPVDPVNPA